MDGMKTTVNGLSSTVCFAGVVARRSLTVRLSLSVAKRRGSAPPPRKGIFNGGGSWCLSLARRRADDRREGRSVNRVFESVLSDVFSHP